ncbi:MAG TPA: HEPN domain-containing protein [Anaerolineae bacterium]|nr:HEPN domain-containing protein [Anaerolineae bacterium]
MSHADEMLRVAEHNLAEGFYSSAVNRAYYAIFYAANALLSTRGLSRGKHSGVIAAFRRYFVKPGLIEAEYSDIYGRVMDSRHTGDYEVDVAIDPQVAEDDLGDARRFVARIKHYLEQEGWL